MPRLLSYFLLMLAFTWGVEARSHSSHSGSAHKSASRHSTSYCYSCARDEHGRIKRSTGARHRFQDTHPCPSTGSRRGACPGYVIDHVKPLKRGGEDKPSNMQWQSKEEAKAKDRIE